MFYIFGNRKCVKNFFSLIECINTLKNVFHHSDLQVENNLDSKNNLFFSQKHDLIYIEGKLKK